MKVWKKTRGAVARWVFGVFAATIVMTSAFAGMGVQPAHAYNPNDTISTFINMAAGKEVDLSKIKLTEAEVRFLGVFMSNFYTPFVTELGSGASDDEVTKATRKDMVKVLQEVLSYKEDQASGLVNLVMARMKDSSTELKWGYSGEAVPFATGKDIDVDTGATPTYYGLMSHISGTGIMPAGHSNPSLQRSKLLEIYKGNSGQDRIDKANAYWDGWADPREPKKPAEFSGGDAMLAFDYKGTDANAKTPEALRKKVMQGQYRYAYLGYGDGDDFKPVFNMDMWGEAMTPSVIALARAQMMVDPKKGFGTSFLDLTTKEMANDEKSIDSLKDALSADQIYGSTILGSKLRVSPFGDIISMGVNHQTIILPGAMNPYNWQSVDKDGADKKVGDKLTPGSNLPLANFAWTSAMGGENKTFNSVKASAEEGANGQVISSVFFGDLMAKKDSGGGGALDRSLKSEESLYKIPLVRGNPEPDITTDGWTATLGGARDAKLLRELYQTYYKKPESFYRPSFIYMDKLHSGMMPFYGTSGVDGKNLEHADASMFTKVHMIDDLKNFEGDKSDPTLELVKADGTVDKFLKEASLQEAFGSAFKSAKVNESGVKGTYSKPAQSVIVTLYMTYVMSSLYDDSTKKEAVGGLGYRLAPENMPVISTDPINWSDIVDEELQKDMRSEAILDWLYYLLHPSEIGYFFEWANNKITALILGWQDKVLGTEGVGALTGSTKFLSFSGYVTTPTLFDVKWTSDIVDLYMDNIVFVMIIVFALMLCYAVARILTVQRALGGAAIFIIGALLPVGLINFAVDTSNNVSDKIYSKKFNYWALTTHQGYAAAIDESATNTEQGYADHISTMYAKREEVRSSAGGSSIVLRWQAPKKMASLQLTGTQKDVSNDSIQKMAGPMFNGFFGGQDFLDGDKNTYLYRSYVDISNFSRYIYDGTMKSSMSVGATSAAQKNWPQGLKNSYANRNSTYADDRKSGYTNTSLNQSTTFKDAQRLNATLKSRIVSDAFGKDISSMKLGQYAGINQDMFKFSIPMFTSDGSLTFKDEMKSDTLPDPMMGGRYGEADYFGLASYGLMSENSFYYFSWMMYDQGMKTDASAAGNYKTMLLGDSNSKFFYNVDDKNYVNGEMKDYMDMKSMFTYVIPYLNAGNEVVREWDSVYGLKIHEGVPTEPGMENESDIKNSKELSQKYWHNVNVTNLGNLYTPWVDLMYDSSYAKPTKVQVAGKNVAVSNPIDPSTYPKERPMVFSKSEMVDYGIKENQLTAVEKKIQNVQADVQDDMINLLNYYTFDDSVLNTAAAMQMSFAFNSEFSESKIFGQSNTIYPQSYELKNFTYDAFLRLILSNTTGLDILDNVSAEKSFYQTVTDQSSIFAAIAMLINSLISSYVLPAFKWAFVVGILFTSFVMLLSSAVRIEQNIFKNVMKSLVKPLLIFLAVNVGMAWFVSLFMSNGYTEITGNEGFNISLGDPVIVLLVMIAVNLIVVFCYFKLIMALWKDLRGYGKAVISSVSGAVSGAADAVVDGASGGRMSRMRSSGGAMMAAGGAAVGSMLANRSGGSSGMSRADRMDRQAYSNAAARDRVGRSGGGSGAGETGGGSSPSMRSRVNGGLAGAANAVRNPIKSAKAAVGNARNKMEPNSIKTKIREGREKTAADNQRHAARKAEASRAKEASRAAKLNAQEAARARRSAGGTGGSTGS